MYSFEFGGCGRRHNNGEAFFHLNVYDATGKRWAQKWERRRVMICSKCSQQDSNQDAAVLIDILLIIINKKFLHKVQGSVSCSGTLQHMNRNLNHQPWGL